jgi:hypothetical protein
VVLFDVQKWIEGMYLEKNEKLVKYQYTDKFWNNQGVSQPPFLIVISGAYYRLDPSWNVRGLGRTDTTLYCEKRV